MLYRRKLVRFLRLYPALFALVLFCGAQLLGMGMGLMGGLLVALVYPAFRLFSVSHGLALGALLLSLAGMISGVGFKGPSVVTSFMPTDTLSAVVFERPRRGAVGQVEVSLLVARDKSRSKELKLAVPKAEKVLCRAVELPWRNISGIKKGDRLVLRGKFKALTSDQLFSYEAALRRRGFVATCKLSHVFLLPSSPAEGSIFEKWRDGIVKAVTSVVGDGESAALFLSMSIGVRDRSSEQVEQAFKRAGLAHLLVVSGYQVTLVFLTAVFILRCMFRLIPSLYLLLNYSLVSSCFGLLVAFLFVQLVGLEGATLRAAIAAFLSSIILIFEKRLRNIQALCSSLLIISTLAPGAVLDPGTQLSFGALFGLALGRSVAQRRLWRYLLASTFATLFTGIVSSFWFGNFPLIGFLLNPIFAPLLSFMACHLGAICLSVHFLGIDPDGWLLTQLVQILWHFGLWIMEFAKWECAVL